jgi:acyl dehydratase
MPLNFQAVGQELGPADVSWTSTDALLYALAVGAGQDDPLTELAFTTENSVGVAQQVLPSFGVLVVQRAHLRPNLGSFDPASLVHGEQSLTLHRPLPVAGRARVTSVPSGIYDKGSGALVVIDSRATDPMTGEVLLTARSSAFIRGEGGFGGDRGPASDWTPPESSPDVNVSASTQPNQALLYRLTGDRNPLHSDPAFAARAGFPRPILHGLCTFGFTARVLVNAVCAGDPTRFRSMSARFSRPVFPGARLTVSIWRAGSAHQFRTSDAVGNVVLDHGTFTVA